MHTTLVFVSKFSTSKHTQQKNDIGISIGKDVILYFVFVFNFKSNTKISLTFNFDKLP